MIGVCVLEDPGKTAKSLSDILGKKQAYYLNLFKKHSSFVWIERKVAPDLSDRLKEAKLPGIHPLRESRRYYPNMSLAAQVLGFVGQDNQGLGGIEYKYDTALKGHSGVTIIPKDDEAFFPRPFERWFAWGSLAVFTGLSAVLIMENIFHRPIFGG